jgi:cytidylate kinase
MWLYGPAGAGKSAIAQSIAALCQQANLLAASFFFSRTAGGRNDESRLIPTLVMVYQLCLSMPAIQKYVANTIEQDPKVLLFGGGTDSRFARGFTMSRMVE